MSWTLLAGLVLALGLAFLALWSRRRELERMRAAVSEREHSIRVGADKEMLQHPVVDLSRCLGCGTCVAACPEEGVLELVHGQAMVVRGARCVGHAACERECPVGAITVTLGDLSERSDVPVLDEGLEAAGTPGLFLAGEVTAHALIKRAVDQGTAVGAEVARRVGSRLPGATRGAEELDLCIVGAGPAGLACSLEARRHGLDFVTLDQETELGGTVAKYPRRKLVLTQPLEMPLYGHLPATEYSKEELIGVWRRIAEEQELPIRGGEAFRGLERDADGAFLVSTETGTYRARHVCLALGRRGSPRKLGVPGEDHPKVAYSLIDASSYRDRRVLVVGGGDSAVEAALGLAKQPGNQVTLSYRRDRFTRIRARNEERLREAVERGALQVVTSSVVIAIAPGSVELEVASQTGTESWTLPNDDVFVMAGGIPPFELLERSGVSFDPQLQTATSAPAEQGTGLVQALGAGFVLALSTLVFALWQADYYLLPAAERPSHEKHLLLRPGMGLGLWMGIAASGLIVVNLLYLVRRSPNTRFELGSLRTWMTSHVATGILALLCATLHGAMSPRHTVGGHAFWALAFLLVTGAIGRYFYAYVPRAANGRELELAEVRAQLGRMEDEWDDGQRRFRERVRDEIGSLIEAGQWQASFLARVRRLIDGQRQLRQALIRIAREGREEGIDADQIGVTLRLARRMHRTALMVSHFEDLRAVLATWRYLHRWVAALMVLLVVLHIGYALAYSGLLAR